MDLLTVVILCMLCHQVRLTSIVEFIGHPKSITAKEDDQVSFQCSVRLSQPSETIQSFWSNGFTFYHSNQDNFITITSSYNVTTLVYTSQLYLLKATRHSNKYYKCVISVPYAHGSFTSHLAELKVLYFLKPHELECDGPSKTVRREYETISIRCEASRANPPVRINWFLCPNETLGLQAETTSTSLQETQAIISDVITDRRLHKKMICCVAKSPAFADQNVHCSIGPFEILHSPSVEITPSNERIILPFVSERTFRCIAHSFPPVLYYSWSCDSYQGMSGCNSNSENMTLTFANSDWETERTIEVSCKARNEIGEARDTTDINLLVERNASMYHRCSRGSVNQHKSLSVNDSESEGGQLRVSTYNGFEQFTCPFNRESNETLGVRWYVNGEKVKQLDSSDTRDFNTGSWHMIIPGKGHRGIITCEVLTITRAYKMSCVLIDSPSSLDDGLSEQTDNHTVSLPQERSEITMHPTSNVSPFTGTLDAPDPTLNGFNSTKLNWIMLVAAVVGFLLLVCAIIAILCLKKQLSRTTTNNTTGVKAGHGGMVYTKESQVSGLNFPESQARSVNEDPIYDIPQGEHFTSQSDGPLAVGSPLLSASHVYEDTIFRWSRHQDGSSQSSRGSCFVQVHTGDSDSSASTFYIYENTGITHPLRDSSECSTYCGSNCEQSTTSGVSV